MLLERQRRSRSASSHVPKDARDRAKDRTQEQCTKPRTSLSRTPLRKRKFPLWSARSRKMNSRRQCARRQDGEDSDMRSAVEASFFVGWCATQETADIKRERGFQASPSANSRGKGYGVARQGARPCPQVRAHGFATTRRPSSFFSRSTCNAGRLPPAQRPATLPPHAQMPTHFALTRRAAGRQHRPQAPPLTEDLVVQVRSMPISTKVQFPGIVTVSRPACQHWKDLQMTNQRGDTWNPCPNSFRSQFLWSSIVESAQKVGVEHC